MKAVVLELRDASAAVLDKEGIVSIVPDRDYRVGQVVEFEARELAPRQVVEKRPSFMRFVSSRAAAAAAALVIAAGGAGTYTAVATPVSSVTVESDPSIQYQLNMLGRVLSVNALNEEAEGMKEDLDSKVKGKKLDDAVQITLSMLEEKGYIDEQAQNPLVFTAEGSWLVNKSKLENTMLSSADVWNQEHNSAIQVEMVDVTQELSQEADEKQTTPGQVVLGQRREEMALGEQEGSAGSASSGEQMDSSKDSSGTEPLFESGQSGSQSEEGLQGGDRGSQGLEGGNENGPGREPAQELSAGTQENGGNAGGEGGPSRENNPSDPSKGNGFSPSQAGTGNHNDLTGDNSSAPGGVLVFPAGSGNGAPNSSEGGSPQTGGQPGNGNETGPGNGSGENQIGTSQVGSLGEQPGNAPSREQNKEGSQMDSQSQGQNGEPELIVIGAEPSQGQTGDPGQGMENTGNPGNSGSLGNETPQGTGPENGFSGNAMQGTGPENGFSGNTMQGNTAPQTPSQNGSMTQTGDTGANGFSQGESGSLGIGENTGAGQMGGPSGQNMPGGTVQSSGESFNGFSEAPSGENNAQGSFGESGGMGEDMNSGGPGESMGSGENAGPGGPGGF